MEDVRRSPTQRILEVLPAEHSDVRREAFLGLRRGEPVAPWAIAERAGLDPERVTEAVAALESRGAVRLDESGSVVGAGGLSVEPTRHRLILSGVPLYTWCAIDAVGIPAALGEDATVETSCPHCGRPIEISMPKGRSLGASGFVAWLPSKEVTRVVDELCPEINLFCDEDHLGAWRADSGDPPGRALGIEEVEELGRRWWADLAPETPGPTGEEPRCC